MEITVHAHRKFSSRVDRARLTRLVQLAISLERSRARLERSSREARTTLSSNHGVAVYVTTDAEIRLLNRKFHATNAPTDVLSFPTTDRTYLGDIVISYDRARIQARAAGWRISDELELLALHGILHLLGYDDKKPQPRKRMWKRQEEILGAINCADNRKHF